MAVAFARFSPSGCPRNDASAAFVSSKAEHLGNVGAIVGDALDAGGLSHGPAAAAARLVVRLFRVDAAWGAKWLTTLLEKRGTISGHGGLADALARADVDRLAPALALAGRASCRELSARQLVHSLR